MITMVTKAVSVNMLRYETSNMIFDNTITCIIVTLFTSFCNGAYLLRLLKEIHALFIDMFLIDIASIYYPNVVHIM